MKTVKLIRVDPVHGDQSEQVTLGDAVESVRKHLNEGGMVFSKGQQLTKEQSDEEIEKQMEESEEAALTKKSPGG